MTDKEPEDEQNNKEIYNQAYSDALDETRRKYLEVLQETIEFILKSPDIQLACLGVAYVLKSPITNMSATKMGKSLNYSHNAISRYSCEYKKVLESINRKGQD